MAHAGTLTINKLNKHYRVKDKNLHILDNISLSIRPGDSSVSSAPAAAVNPPCSA